MIDINKPLRLRDEADDREVRYVGEMPDGRPVFAIPDASDHWFTTSRQKDGRIKSGWDNGGDIVNVPEKRVLPEMWLNVYADRQPTVHYTRREADDWAILTGTRIDCVPLTGIEYTVGEGLEDET